MGNLIGFYEAIVLASVIFCGYIENYALVCMVLVLYSVERLFYIWRKIIAIRGIIAKEQRKEALYIKKMNENI